MPAKEFDALRFSKDLLPVCSLFIKRATPDDIEFERQALEAEYHQQLKVFEVESVTRSGARCTRVSWECL